MNDDGVGIREATYADVPRLAAVYRDAYAANVEAGFPSFAATVSAGDVEGWLHDRDVFVAELVGAEAATATDGVDALGVTGAADAADAADAAAADAADAAHAADAADATGASEGDSPDAVVGAVQLRRRPDRGVLELSRLAVVEAYKERGIGGLLVEHAEAVARERGHDRLRLRTFTGHPILPDWYERLGYERVGREPMTSRPYDVLIMEKRL